MQRFSARCPLGKSHRLRSSTIQKFISATVTGSTARSKTHHLHAKRFSSHRTHLRETADLAQEGQRADRLIKHPWELEASWRCYDGTHANSAEQAMPPGLTLHRRGRTRRARATGWLQRFITPCPGRPRRL